MTTTITADNVHQFTNRALVIAKALLQDEYVQMTTTYQRHGWAAGFEVYTAEKNAISDTLSIITAELKQRYEKEMRDQAALDEARAAVAAAVKEAA